MADILRGFPSCNPGAFSGAVFAWGCFGIPGLKQFSANEARMPGCSHVIPVALRRTIYHLGNSVMIFYRKLLSAMVANRSSLATFPVGGQKASKMYSWMLSPRNKSKVFNIIVRPIAIDVMYNFTRLKRSFQIIAHYISMFRDITIFHGIRMRRKFRIFVSSFIRDPRQYVIWHTRPLVVICTKYITPGLVKQGE